MTKLVAPPRPSSFDSEPVDNFDSRRDAVDMVSSVRTSTVRVALLGGLLKKTVDECPDQDPDRQKNLNLLVKQIEEMQKICLLLTGNDPVDGVAPALANWLREQADLAPSATQAIVQMTELSDDVYIAAKDTPDNMTQALARHMEVGRNGFAQIVTEFCNQLWASLDEKREQATQRASQATQAVSDMLTRLEYIGKHVRLVSLNASVEAARAGDAGLGLAVIATEFKTLAEEIQSLANNARTKIDAI